MPTPAHVLGLNRHRIGDSRLARRLRRETRAEVLFDAFSRGRYSTDASIYQIEPIGVVLPKSAEDVEAIVAIAGEEGVPVLARGGGTSQCGQTVGEALVVDTSKFLNHLINVDSQARTARVEPGLVLDHLNAALKPNGLWFPVDVSTSSRATIGGMAGNNSCGARSIRYGTMRDNVRAIDAVLIGGGAMRFGDLPDGTMLEGLEADAHQLADRLLTLGRDRSNEIQAAFPDLMRRVGGYNVDALMPAGAPQGPWADGTVYRPTLHPNLAHLLVGSEGTLAFSTRLDLDLQPIPSHKVLGVCHFPTFHSAMESARHIVKLGPAAVELVDRTMIDLARDIPIFRATVERFVKGKPDALLLVEFAGEDADDNVERLKRLGELIADLGFPGAVVEAIEPSFQKAVWEIRKSGLNIMMSMKGDGKPVSFIEDCAVRLEDLADYTARLTEVFHRHGTEGTWYAHASSGCLHVRPIINLKSEVGAEQMRDIAEAAFEMVRGYKGSHSGEHGDGLVRSEFHEAMFGAAMVETFSDVKKAFDPENLMNPGKIVAPPRMDDRNLFRFKPGYRTDALDTGLDWSEWGGFAAAVEMCNNNGACRKREAGVMCPSFRATGDEQHLTRGRANALRLALSGQLGKDAIRSDEMADAVKLCVGCKGCKRECPTGVDMARMKIEVLRQRLKSHPLAIFERLVAYLPRYAPLASKLGSLLNLRNGFSGAAWLGERLTGFAAARPLPKWAAKPFSVAGHRPRNVDGPEVVLWVDTFSTYFEPENAEAALAVLEGAGYRIHLASPADAGRPLCCGRTFLSAGLVDEAKTEAKRMLEALAPFVERGVPIIGLEPSCLFSLRDEFTVMIPGPQTEKLAAGALLFEEFLAREIDAGRFAPDLAPVGATRALLHGHCHQKAFDAMGAVEGVLSLIPDLETETVESSCCGMAGSFGYHRDTYDVSLGMAELSLLPAVRSADPETVIVADGTSCRHQIEDGAGREARHVACLLAESMAAASNGSGGTGQ